jgi:hypothetical protein
VAVLAGGAQPRHQKTPRRLSASCAQCVSPMLIRAAIVLMLLIAGPAGAANKRRCRKAKDCESCTAIGSCGWCLESGRCLDRAAHPTGFWSPEGKTSDECGGTLQTSCLSVDPTQDSDRVSQLIDRAVAPERHAKATAANGRRIAKALDLRSHMQHIVETFPGAEFISTDPPIIHFSDFLTAEECAAVVEAGETSLKPSTGALSTAGGNVRTEQELERAKHSGRSSFNTWCMGGCAAKPAMKRIQARIANATGFSQKNMEYLQILRCE